MERRLVRTLIVDALENIDFAWEQEAEAMRITSTELRVGLGTDLGWANQLRPPTERAMSYTVVSKRALLTQRCHIVTHAQPWGIWRRLHLVVTRD